MVKMVTKCDVCKKAVKAGEALGCVNCSVWRHAKCCSPQIPIDLVQSLAQSNCFQFNCGQCQTTPAATNDKLTQAIDRLTNTLAVFEQRLINIEAKVQSIAGNIPTRTQVIDLIHETVERRENRNQVVVCGVPETDIEDAEYVAGLLNTIQATDCVPSEVYRMGRLGADRRGRPRLLKVRFGRSWQRDMVLSKARALRGSTRFPGVYIRPSHTANQRQLIASLYEQKEACERDGNEYYIKRHGPVEEWEVVRSERPINTRHNNDDSDLNDDTWQTVPPRRRSQVTLAPHPNVPENHYPPNNSR